MAVCQYPVCQYVSIQYVSVSVSSMSVCQYVSVSVSSMSVCQCVSMPVCQYASVPSSDIGTLWCRSENLSVWKRSCVCVRLKCVRAVSVLCQSVGAAPVYLCISAPAPDVRLSSVVLKDPECGSVDVYV